MGTVRKLESVTTRKNRPSGLVKSGTSNSGNSSSNESSKSKVYKYVTGGGITKKIDPKTGEVIEEYYGSPSTPEEKKVYVEPEPPVQKVQNVQTVYKAPEPQVMVDKYTGQPVSVMPGTSDSRYVSRTQYDNSNPWATIYQETKRPQSPMVQKQPTTQKRQIGMVTAATPDQIRAMKVRQSNVGQFLTGASEGFFSPNQQTYGKMIGGTTAQSLGMTSGLVGNIALMGEGPGFLKGLGKAKAATTAKVGKILEPVTQSKNFQNLQKLMNTQVGRFSTSTTAMMTQGVAIEKIGDAITKSRLSKEEKKAMGLVNMDTARSAAIRAEQKVQGPWYRQALYEVSTIFSTDKGQAYQQEMTRQLKAQGLTGPTLQAGVTAGMKQRKGRAATEAVELLNVARLSEELGQGLVNKGLKGTTQAGWTKLSGWQRFGRTAGNIGIAGVSEGAASVALQDISREQKVTTQKVGLGMAFGGITASGIGGAIVGTQKKLPTVSKVIEYGAYFTDPFEKPGDILAGAKNKLFKSFSKPVTFVPSTTNTPTLTKTMQKTSVSEVMSMPTDTRKKAGTSANTKTVTEVPTKVEIPTIINQPTRKRGRTVTIVPDETIIGQVPVDPTPKVPVEIPVDTITNTNTDTFQNTNSDTDTNTNIFTNTMTFTNIPTVTTMPRLPPPVPMPFSFPSFGTGSSVGKKRTKFVNELEASAILFNELVGGGAPSRKGNKPISPRNESINRLIFGAPQRPTKANKKKKEKMFNIFDIL